MAEEIEDQNSGEETSDESIIRIARERYKIATEAYEEIHKKARLDDDFRVGEQWPDEVRNDREKEGRPCLTVNRLPQFIHQVVNDQKQNNPTASFTPVDDNADIETAKIYQGLNRNIESSSNAAGARNWAFDGAVSRGFGYFRIRTDYVSPTSFLQEIRYERIFDAYSVKLDPNHVEPDGSDANYGFIETRMQKDEFISEYGDAELAKNDTWDAQVKQLPDWVDKDSCLVVEYFYKDFKREKILLLSDGTSLTETEYKERLESGEISPELEIVNQRKTVTAKVKWIKFAGDEILDRTEWASQWIPIIPVYGEMIVHDGKKVLESVIRHAIDSQRMLNYWVSAETETIALAPRAPWIGFKGQFNDDKWATANAKSHAYLEVDPIDVNGNPAPLPQRNVYEAPVQAITNARVQAQEDLKATTGIYDAALGNRSNEISGVAIKGRQAQAQTSNYHFMDNYEASATHGARIVAELIPVTYDTSRTVTILGESGEAEKIRINEEFNHNGQLRTYDLSRGKYDLSIDMGPSFATKRQEASAAMAEVIQMNPQLMSILGDLFFSNMDWPGAKEMAERFKRTMDPKILDDNAQIPPAAQAQIMQMGQAIQHLQAVNADMQQKLNAKILDIQSKERMKAAELETDLIKEQMKIPTENTLIQLQNQLAELQQWQDQMTQLFNGAGPQAAVPPMQEQPIQPTGGEPGPYMGV